MVPLGLPKIHHNSSASTERPRRERRDESQQQRAGGRRSSAGRIRPRFRRDWCRKAFGRDGWRTRVFKSERASVTKAERTPRPGTRARSEQRKVRSSPPHPTPPTPSGLAMCESGQSGSQANTRLTNRPLLDIQRLHFS